MNRLSLGVIAVALGCIGGTALTGEESHLPKSSGSDRLHIHIAEGMWSQLWKIPDALDDSYSISESFLCSRYGFGTWLKDFPARKEDLFANQVVILANIPADAFASKENARSDAWIEEFLIHGGGVFMLGGNYSLGTGGNKGGHSFGDLTGTAYERMLPVIVHEGDIPFDKQNKPIQLLPAIRHPILEGIDWSDKPVTLFFHEVVPRGDAQVLVTSGTSPILILGSYKGARIALWTATLHGESPEGTLEYWQWKEWPKLVRNITAWLASAKK